MSINSDDLRQRVPPAAVAASRSGLGSEFDETSLRPVQAGGGNGITVNLTNSFQDLGVSVSFTCRVRTLLMVTFLVDVATTVAADAIICKALLDGVDLQGGAGQPPMLTAQPSSITGANNAEATMSVTLFVPAGPGKHTLTAQGKRTGAGPNSLVFGSRIDFIFMGKAST